MAIANFPILPLTSKNDETVRVNKYAIIDVRVVNVGKSTTQNENWYVQVNVLNGKFYLLKHEEAPYQDKASAVAARDVFLATFD